MIKLSLIHIDHNFVKSEFLGTRSYIFGGRYRPLLQLRTAHFQAPADRVNTVPVILKVAGLKLNQNKNSHYKTR